MAGKVSPSSSMSCVMRSFDRRLSICSAVSELTSWGRGERKGILSPFASLICAPLRTHAIHSRRQIHKYSKTRTHTHTRSHIQHMTSVPRRDRKERAHKLQDGHSISIQRLHRRDRHKDARKEAIACGRMQTHLEHHGVDQPALVPGGERAPRAFERCREQAVAQTHTSAVAADHLQKKGRRG